MVDLIVDGRLWLTDGTDYLKLACARIFHDIILDPEEEHYPGNIHLVYDLEYRYLLVKAEEIKIKDHDDFATIVSTLLDWQKNETITVSIVRNVSNDKIKLDGTYTNCPMKLRKPGLKELEKISPGDQEKFQVGGVLFVQSGDMS